MNLGSLRRLSVEDYPELPEGFVQQYNETLENVYTALNGRLTLSGNFNVEERTIEVEDSVAEDLELKTLQGPARYVVHAPELDDFSRLAWSNLRPGVVRVRVTFDSMPTDPVRVAFVFIGA